MESLLASLSYIVPSRRCASAAAPLVMDLTGFWSSATQRPRRRSSQIWKRYFEFHRLIPTTAQAHFDCVDGASGDA
jgi:hypothetical protein